MKSEPTPPLFHRALAALGLLAILVTALRLDIRDFLRRPPLVDGDSRFQGSVQQLADGSFVMRGDADRPSVAYVPLRLRPRTLYFLEIELAGSPKIGLDFFEGPEYDFDEQEATLPAGEKGRLRTRIFRSGDAPDRALFRVFFHDSQDVWVGSVRLYQVKDLYGHVQFVLVGLSLLLAGGLAVQRGSSPRLRALGLGIAMFLFYRLAEPAVADNLGDNFWYVPSGVSLIEDGDLDLSEYLPYGLQTGDYRIFESDGKRYNFFPPGTTLATVPFILAAIVFNGLDEHPLDFAARLSFLTAAALAAAAAALLYFLLCGMTSRGKALLLTAVFALATPHWTTHAGSLWSHNALLPFFLWALIALRSRRAWTAAIPLAMGVLVRPDFAPAAFLSLLYIWFFRPRQRARFVIASSAAAAVLAIASLALHEWAVPPYYQVAPRLSWESFPEAMLGHLISPNRGLFVFAPIFLGSVWGLLLGLRRGGEAPFYGLLGAMTAAQWVAISLFVHWWGGHSYGPRLFSPMLPVFVVLLVPVLERWRSMARLARIALGSAAAVLLAWSLFVQIRGVTDPQVQRWNSTPNVDANPERIWDWRDAQILRGLGDRD